MSYEKKLITPENSVIVTVLASIVLVLCLTVSVRFVLNDLIERIELKSYDWRAQKTAPGNVRSDDVVLLVVDDISIQRIASSPELGLSRWPWPRVVQADIIKYLRYAGAKAIIYDIIFEGVEGNRPDNIASDNAFIDEVKKADDVFSSVTFSYSKRALLKYDNAEIYEKNILNISSPQLKQAIKRFSVKPVIENIPEDIEINIQFFNVSNVLNGLLNNLYGLGSVNVPQNLDGIARTTRPLTFFNGNYYPSLPLAIYLKENPNAQIKIDKNYFYLNDNKIQLNDQGAHYVTWYGPPATFSHYRALDVLLAQKVRDQGKPDPLDPSKFKDKYVVFGLTASATDILPTSMSSTYPGPEFIATTITNYLDNTRFVSKVSPLWNYFLVIIFCLGAGLTIVFTKSGFKGISVSLLFLIVYIYICFFSFVEYFKWFEMVYPSLIILSTIMFTFVCKYIVTRKAYEDTYVLATTDGLTGLNNHRYFQDSLTVILQRAQRHSYPVSLFLIDIDNFKKINDTYGHQAGDKILKETAERLKAAIRSTDLIARYGGEEMVIVLDNTPFENATIPAEKLLKSISEKEFMISSDVKIQVTVSIGLATYPVHGASAPQLIEIADQGLYIAKNNGKNQFGVINTDDDITRGVIEDTKKREKVDLHLKVDQEIFEVLQDESNCFRKEDVERWLSKKIKDDRSSQES